MRRKLVSAIRYVDAVVLGSGHDPFGSLSLEPDIVALGYDQENITESILSEITKRYLNTKVVTLKSSTPQIKTTKTLSRKGNVVNEL